MDLEFVQDLQDPDYVDAFIQEWNESRLDMFALSLPNEDLQFSGVMRFYFQDRGQKAVTKCIRVNSEQTVAQIMPTLVEKFCPDMKMLTTPNYELYEIHGTGDARKLPSDEKLLITQLLWHKEDREGRFVLQDGNVKIQPIKFFEANQDEGQLKRRLSRREKKDLKKKRKEDYILRTKNKEKALVDKVYNELPESSLTRTISNPEAVMRRRRQLKLEKRIKEFQNKEGPQTGGILKIFAQSLKPEIPYKTILASVKDNTSVVIKAALEKFLLTKEHPNNFCLVMVVIPPGDPNAPGNVAKERIIRNADCPLAIQNSWPKSKGTLTFHLRRAHGIEPPAASKEPVNAKKSRNFSTASNKKSKNELLKNIPPAKTKSQADVLDKDVMPYFLELTPEGKEINYKPKVYYIKPQETIIGSSRNPLPGVQYLQLFSPKILASHCSIVNVDGTVSMAPHGPDADVRILGKRIFDNSLLKSGDIVQFGGLHTFRFCNPMEESDSSSLASEGLHDSMHSSSSMEFPSREKKPVGHPISPELRELILNEQIGSAVDDEHVLETTFGVSGEIETNKTKKPLHAAKSYDNLQEADHRQKTSLQNSIKHRQSAPDILNAGLNEDMLPASLAFIDHGKDAFFAAVISGVNGAAVNFKLAPTYTLYLSARHVLSPHFKPGINPSEQARFLSGITKQIALSIQQTIQENDYLAGGLAFWMANASELLHFYRQDVDLGPVTQSAQAILAQSIQEAFALLVNAMEEELSLALPAFLDPTDSVDIHPQDLDSILNDDVLERAESMELLNWTSDDNYHTFHMTDGPNSRTLDQWITPAARIRHNGIPIMADILYILSSAMSLLRRCRVNAALTIQLFSQLFHFINMWIFNKIVLEPDLRLCTRLWGHCLQMRLSFVEAWAERQGLELAADCHLARIVQASHLLEASKDTIEDLADLTSTCFKLNSVQLRVLLENYLPEDDEPLLPQDVIDKIVDIAESTSDEITYNEGREVKLEEDIQLQLPFLLPEEGYSSDIIRGVPPGLQDFLEPLCATGLCELTLNPHSMGVWTVYQEPYQEDADDTRDSQYLEELPIQRVTIDKGKSGLGLSICAAKGIHSDFSGIYIKAVIKGSLADKDGRLQGGDQILSVNETGLVDITQTQAAQIMGKSGSVITMEIIKEAAFYHGLANIVDDAEKRDESQGIKMEQGSSGDNAHARQSSRDSDYMHVRQRSGDSGDYKRDVEDTHSPFEDTHSPSDYDEDGNLLTKLEKEKLARQKQREREYEERLAKWEEERKKKEDEEERKKERMQEDEAEVRYEMEVKRKQAEREAFEEAEMFRLEKERYDREKQWNEQQTAMEEERVWLEREENERRRIQYEERIEDDEIERNRIEVERRRIESEEAKRVAEEEREKRRIEGEERERMIEERRSFEEQERRRVEEEEIENRRIEDERRRKIEAEEREKKRIEAEEREKRRIETEERERQRIEEEREKRRIEAEERERQRIEEEREKRRLETEARERQRIEEEREKRRIEADERERQRIEEEREKRRIEAEKRERQRIEEEREKRRLETEARERQRIEVERRRAEAEEQERRRIKEEEMQRKRIEDEEKRKREYEEERRKEEEEKRRAEKEHLILERERQYKEREERLERARKEDEQRRQQERMEEDRIRLLEEKQRKKKIEEEKRVEDERRREKLKLVEERRRKESEERKRFEENKKNDNLDKEMASIDDALKEAERIAAEMDFLMIEEEQKMEEDQKQKRMKEKYGWERPDYQPPDLQAVQTEKKIYRIETKLKRTSSKENILQDEYFPPPPRFVGGRYETNIDSSDDEFPDQREWQSQQTEKKRRQREEQQRLMEERAKRNEPAKPKPPQVKPKQFRSKERVTTRKQSSDEEEAPPRPPPPKSPHSPQAPTNRFSYSSSNGLRITDNTQVNVTFKQPTVVNQGVGEPEILDFESKMKLFGKFQG